MEKERAMGLSPDFKESLIAHKYLPEQNDIKSCQYKIEVCKELMDLTIYSIDDTGMQSIP